MFRVNSFQLTSTQPSTLLRNAVEPRNIILHRLRTTTCKNSSSLIKSDDFVHPPHGNYLLPQMEIALKLPHANQQYKKYTCVNVTINFFFYIRLNRNNT